MGSQARWSEEPTVKKLVVYFMLVLATRFAVPVHGEHPTSYSGYQLMKLHSEDPDTLTEVLGQLRQKFEADVLKQLLHTADVIIAPHQLRHVRDELANYRTTSTVVVTDVQRLLEEEFAKEQQLRKRRAADRNVTNSYLTYTEIENYLYKELPKLAVAADITVKDIGKTFEGRSIHVVELREIGSVTTKPAILIEAGIHAREWIAPALALNIIDKLASNPDRDPDVSDLLQKFDWFIVPSVNPDGYVYSHSAPAARLWRKTRTTAYNQAANGACRGIGVDANRNFGYDWDPARGGSPCVKNLEYSGPAPFSEPETRAVRDWILSHATHAKAYVSIHSYGQYLLYPYGYDMNKPLQNKELHVDLSGAFRTAMLEKAVDYVVGNLAQKLYVVSGDSPAYAKGSGNVTVAFCLELPPKGSSPGFRLAESRVADVVSDTWHGLKTLVKRLHSKLSSS